MQDRIFDMIVNSDEITYQSIIQDVIKAEDMNPWDVDVALITKKYIQMLKKLKELDFRVTGKVILTAALLLKLKSKRLITDDINGFDSLLASTNEEDSFDDHDDEYDFYNDSSIGGRGNIQFDKHKLIPRTPQPRNRKVSVSDLMNALEKAMDVRKKTLIRNLPTGVSMKIPSRKFDITTVIREVYSRVRTHFLDTPKNKLHFHNLLPEESNKLDKVFTFIPLLHLQNQRKLDLEQEDHFGDIEIKVVKKKISA